jgi:hypothetical protein
MNQETNNIIQDEHTRNLINGLHLLLTYYPQAKVRMGYSEEELTVREVTGILPPENDRHRMTGTGDYTFMKMLITGNTNS